MSPTMAPTTQSLTRAPVTSAPTTQSPTASNSVLKLICKIKFMLLRRIPAASNEPKCRALEHLLPRVKCRRAQLLRLTYLLESALPLQAATLLA
jgi:hypothetical protein